MKNPICVASGFLYRIIDDINKRIDKIREFSLDGIELHITESQYLSNFEEVNKENLAYLQSLNFNSIHAPAGEFSYGSNGKSKKTLEAIEKMYKKINAKNLVFHGEQIEDISVFNNYDFIVSIENGDWNEKDAKTPDQIGEILEKNPNLKFTFDFAHAFSVSPDDIPKYIDRFGEKLVGIHLSMIEPKTKEHWFVHKFDSKEIKNLLKCLKKTNVHIVLECVALNKNEICLIKKEIKYIKSI